MAWPASAAFQCKQAGVARLSAAQCCNCPSTQARRGAAATRIRQIREAEAKGEPPPAPMQDKIGFSINGEPWDAEKNPVDTGFPGFVDRWLNGQVARGNANIKRLKHDPAAVKAAVLAAVPTTLFVLVAVFALMLKLAYVFRCRLHMEHLVVALHSHAFLCLARLLVLLVRCPRHFSAGSRSRRCAGPAGWWIPPPMTTPAPPSARDASSAASR